MVLISHYYWKVYCSCQRRYLVLIQGVEVESISVSLHQITLQYNPVSGVVTVGIRPSLPVTGVDLILNNDLARGKVSADLCVTHIPLCHDETVSEDTTIYPACAVTRAMARTKEQDNTLGSSMENTTCLDNHDEVGSDGHQVSHNCETDPLINLSDTFMSHDTNVDQVGDEDHVSSPEPSGRCCVKK